MILANAFSRLTRKFSVFWIHVSITIHASTVERVLRTEHAQKKIAMITVLLVTVLQIFLAHFVKKVRPLSKFQWPLLIWGGVGYPLLLIHLFISFLFKMVVDDHEYCW